MKLKLKNKSSLVKIYVLLHQHYCEPLGKCECIKVIRHDSRIPISLSLLPGETSRYLPEEVLQIPEITRDVKKRHLRYRRQRSSSTKKSETTKKRRRRKSKIKDSDGRSA